jgi:hypothetical protein
LLSRMRASTGWCRSNRIHAGLWQTMDWLPCRMTLCAAYFCAAHCRSDSFQSTADLIWDYACANKRITYCGFGPSIKNAVQRLTERHHSQSKTGLSQADYFEAGSSVAGAAASAAGAVASAAGASAAGAVASAAGASAAGASAAGASAAGASATGASAAGASASSCLPHAAKVMANREAINSVFFMNFPQKSLVMLYGDIYR